MQRVDIVIVNYRTADLTIDCLRSLAPEMERHPGDRVFVTDNASGDDSVERIGEAIEAEDMRWATLMLLEKNGGFAFGNNAAIRRALGDDDPPAYVLLLNPDTIVRGGAIDALAPGASITGQPGCAGVIRGTARVVHDPSEPGDLEPGDILIARHTDPSWTPIFAAVSGVVVNVGATISHAVIVARELGVPCVVSAEAATDRIPDGAMIEVDGGAGTVTLIAAHGEPDATATPAAQPSPAAPPPDRSGAQPDPSPSKKPWWKIW